MSSQRATAEIMTTLVSCQRVCIQAWTKIKHQAVVREKNFQIFPPLSHA